MPPGPGSWGFLPTPGSARPMPGPAGCGMPGEVGAMLLALLLPGKGRPAVVWPDPLPAGTEPQCCPGPWPCMGLLAFMPWLLPMPGLGPL